MNTIKVNPGDTVPGCELLKETFYGVRLPRTIRVYDCRFDEETTTVKRESHFISNHWLTLYAGERAIFAEGVINRARSLVGCQTYVDARKTNASELRRQALDIRRTCARLLWEYRRAKRNLAKEGDGGSVVSLPTFATIANFGWSVYARESDHVVASFR